MVRSVPKCRKCLQGRLLLPVPVAPPARRFAPTVAVRLSCGTADRPALACARIIRSLSPLNTRSLITYQAILSEIVSHCQYFKWINIRAISLAGINWISLA
jgi:hypothetical protein